MSMAKSTAWAAVSVPSVPTAMVLSMRSPSIRWSAVWRPGMLGAAGSELPDPLAVAHSLASPDPRDRRRRAGLAGRDQLHRLGGLGGLRGDRAHHRGGRAGDLHAPLPDQEAHVRPPLRAPAEAVERLTGEDARILALESA